MTPPSQPAAQPEFVADRNREATRCRACDGQGYKWVRVLLPKDAA